MKNCFCLILFFFTLWCIPLSAADRIDKIIDKVATNFGNGMGLKYGMEVLLIGRSSLIDAHRADCSISFYDSNPRTIDEVRPIVIDIADQMWELVKKEPIFLERRMDDFRRYPDLEKPEISPNLIGFKIGYWDENVNRRGYPYISHVKYVDQTFYFYYADPKTQKLQEPIVESLEVARKKLQKPQ